MLHIANFKYRKTYLLSSFLPSVGLIFYSSSKEWIRRHTQDTFVKKSQELNLRSRASFKLKDIQEKYRIINKTDFVIDLGAAPGGWSVVASELLDFSNNALLISVDLLQFPPIKNCFIIQGDIFSSDISSKIRNISKERLSNVILSDMLPNSSGHHSTDHFRSMDICFKTLEFCKIHLKPGGIFFCKYLRGQDDKELVDEAKRVFKEVIIVKPKASRTESTEIYFLGRNKI